MKTIILEEYSLVPVKQAPVGTYLKEVNFPKVEVHIAEKEMTWLGAMGYAAKLDSTTGDWRLPTKEQLQAYAEQLRDMGLSNSFWTSTVFPNFILNAWSVNLEYGATFYNPKSQNYRVICVRNTYND